MKPRPEPARAITPPLRAASPMVYKRRKRLVGFKKTQNRRESWVRKNSKGGRPSKEAPRGNGSQNVNLPLLLAAHIGRSENGQPLQSSLTSAYEGQALSNNIGGNLPPNGRSEEQRNHQRHGTKTRNGIPGLGKWAGRSEEQRNHQRHGTKTRNGIPGLVSARQNIKEK
nr:hypothetical protein [Tanacetum cinerariifolium]